MSDRIGVMHEGILEQLGTPNEVYYQPQTSYVADFVGNANILRLGWRDVCHPLGKHSDERRD